MFEIGLSALILLAAAALPAFFLSRSRLTLRLDALFLWFYAQTFVYLNLSTLLILWLDDLGPLAETYVLLEALCFGLFQCPLVLIYVVRKNKSAVQSRLEGAITGPIFAFISVLSALIFLWVCNEQNLWFMRIGSEGVLAKLTALSTWQFAAFRGFYHNAPILFLLMVIGYFADRHRPLWMLLSSTIVGGTYVLYVSITSRQSVALALVLILAIVTLVSRNHVLSVLRRKAILFIIAGILIAGFAFSLASSVRTLYIEQGSALNSEVFSNALRMDSIGSESTLELARRLNGLKLMSHIYEAAATQEYLLGEPWVDAIRVSFLQYFDKQEADLMKQSLAGSPKIRMMMHYLSMSAYDVESCRLTDVFGNFGPPGLVLAGLLIGWILRASRGLIYQVRNFSLLLLGIAGYFTCSQFEGEFVQILIGWSRFLPALLLALIVRPFSVRTVSAFAEVCLRNPAAFPTGPIRPSKISGVAYARTART